MSGRLVAIAALGALGGAAWLAWRRSRPDGAGDTSTGLLALPWGSDDTFQLPPGLAPADDQAGQPTGDYASRVIGAESSGSSSAKNPRSSASGLYQFTKATWQSVGGAWGSDPSKPFGGLNPSAEEQTARFNLLTQSNAAGISAKGFSVTDAALYVAHFLGLGNALRVLRASPDSSLVAALGKAGPGVIAANPNLRGFTVGDFLQWASGKA